MAFAKTAKPHVLNSTSPMLTACLHIQVLASYSYASAAWQLTQAFPLLVWPQAIVGLLNVDTTYASPGPTSTGAMEIYFARSLGLTLMAQALVCLVLSGAFPLGSSIDGTLSSHTEEHTRECPVSTILASLLAETFL